MARGFLSGIIWGTVVGTLGSAALSLLTALPPGARGAPEAVETEVTTAVQPEGVTETPQIPSADVTGDDVPLIGLSDPADGGDEAVPEPDKNSADVPDVDTPDVAMDAPEAGSAAPDVPQTEQSDGAEGTELALAPEAPAVIEAPDIDTSVPERPGQPEDTTGSEPSETEADAGVEVAESESGVGEPVEEITDMAPNVTTNRLPSIGDENAIEDVAPEASAPTEGADILGAMAWNAVPFENPDSKPVYAIVLIETPDGALTPESAASLGFPVTVVLDAATAGVKERAEAYHTAGHEVMFTLALPSGAKPVDIEVAFERASSTIPVAVGVMEQTENGFGSDRMIAQHVISIAAQSGHGVVGHGKGLNPIVQLAEREGVPAALSFRVFDEQNPSAPVIRRYLDRAAFRAQQEGAVVMVGHAYAESLAALVEWAAEERAASMALAPISAALRQLQ